MAIDRHRQTERLLRTYPALRSAAGLLEEELNAASSLLQVRASSSGSTDADHIDEHLFGIEEGSLRLRYLRARIGRIEQALDALSETDRKILEGFFFGQYTRDTPFDLMEELGYEKSQLYRRRRRAVEQFELHYSGCDIA